MHFNGMDIDEIICELNYITCELCYDYYIKLDNLRTEIFPYILDKNDSIEDIELNNLIMSIVDLCYNIYAISSKITNWLHVNSNDILTITWAFDDICINANKIFAKTKYKLTLLDKILTELLNLYPDVKKYLYYISMSEAAIDVDVLNKNI